MTRPYTKTVKPKHTVGYKVITACKMVKTFNNHDNNILLCKYQEKGSQSLSLYIYCLLVKSESIPPNCVSFSLLNSVSSHSCVCWTSLIDPSKWLRTVPMQLSVLLAVFQPGRIQNLHLQRKLQFFPILILVHIVYDSYSNSLPMTAMSKLQQGISQYNTNTFK